MFNRSIYPGSSARSPSLGWSTTVVRRLLTTGSSSSSPMEGSGGRSASPWRRFQGLFINLKKIPNFFLSSKSQILIIVTYVLFLLCLSYCLQFTLLLLQGQRGRKCGWQRPQLKKKRLHARTPAPLLILISYYSNILIYENNSWKMRSSGTVNFSSQRLQVCSFIFQR